ncbi:MAG: hypothetical protein WC748_01705 [Legionellales bacterium]|jgi:hypothetical protein
MKRFNVLGYVLVLQLCFVSIAFATTGYTLSAQTEPSLKENTTSAVTLFLTDDGRAIVENDLKTVHTEKIHALIIDPTLTDYQHIHPTVGKKAGEYVFNFTPHTQNNYRIWLDITPKNDAQRYVIADMFGINKNNPSVIKTLNLVTTIDGYDFKLKFDQPLKVGAHVMSTVIITDKNGKPVTNLEPIMEAFAHIVAFNEDYETILHVHPMGSEPKDPALRGGPEIDFHLTPSKIGFIKIFVQVQINGKEIFAPFGVEVTS